MVHDQVYTAGQLEKVKFSSLNLKFYRSSGRFVQLYIEGWKNPFAVSKWLHHVYDLAN